MTFRDTEKRKPRTRGGEGVCPLGLESRVPPKPNLLEYRNISVWFYRNLPGEITKKIYIALWTLETLRQTPDPDAERHTRPTVHPLPDAHTQALAKTDATGPTRRILIAMRLRVTAGENRGAPAQRRPGVYRDEARKAQVDGDGRHWTESTARHGETRDRPHSAGGRQKENARASLAEGLEGDGGDGGDRTRPHRNLCASAARHRLREGAGERRPDRASEHTLDCGAGAVIFRLTARRRLESKVVIDGGRVWLCGRPWAARRRTGSWWRAASQTPRT